MAYDGSAYAGYQRQKTGTATIQGAVERALTQLAGQAVTVYASGRTDSGVHASGQVIAFDLAWRHSELQLLRALNALLPEDIALQTLRTTRPDFHPRFDALARVYEYSIVNAATRQPLWRRGAWQVFGDLNFDTLQAAADLLVGRHDYGAFGQAPQGNNTVREVTLSRWTRGPLRRGRLLRYRVEGNAFLYHMVRRMVGMQVDVAQGRLDLAAFEQVFRSGDLAQAGTLAPAQGLVLLEVRYAD
ncbi:MAG: tRNA pseudouridine(38-40) synthase TruA [Anaerolineaceae bacterium]|nr:tRNA pseudouridine(38-40) synthase TruA [Anaerolineaceae bacterium]